MTTPIAELVKDLKFITLLASGDTMVLSCSHPRIQRIWVYGGGSLDAHNEQLFGIGLKTAEGVSIRLEGNDGQMAAIFRDADEMLHSLSA